MSRPRRRRRLLWLLALLALPFAAYAVLAFLLEPERLGGLLLQRAARATGLELTVERPARLALWPRLQLELSGLTARAPGAPSAVLRAERIDVALPLALLWRGSDPEVGALRLQRPQIDLDALLHWRSRSGDGAAPQLPQPAVELALIDGRLVADGWQLEALELRMSPLASGEPAELTASGRWHTPTQQLPFALRLTATPVDAATGLLLQAVELRVGAEHAADALQLAGSAQLATPTVIELVGRAGAAWPAQWPALPEPLAGEWPGLAVEFNYSDGDAAAGEFALRVGAAPRLLVLRGRLEALRQWLSAEPRALLPALEATLELDALERDGVRIEGLSVKLAPAAADD